MVPFAQFVTTYANKINPDTEKVFTAPEIAKATRLAPEIIADWQELIKKTNMDYLTEKGRAATDDEFIAAYEEFHPGEVPVMTPFGLKYRPDKGGDFRAIGELTVGEFKQLMQQILNPVA